VVRFFILNSHYRSPLNYCDENLDEALAALTRLYTALRGLNTPSDAGMVSKAAPLQNLQERFQAAMNDDFNTAEAIAVLFEGVREVNRLKTDQPDLAPVAASQLKAMAGVLGLLQTEPEAFFKAGTGTADNVIDEAAIESLIQQRLDARSNKNWAEADRIRDVLSDQGIVLEDAAGKTTWRRG
jgi:cysteinyl-tRNA synthetase